MRKGLVTWILLIIAAFILYFFANETVTLALLLALIAALPLSFLVLRLGSDKAGVSLTGPEAEDGRQFFTLHISNGSWLPLASVHSEVVCRNLRTGENDVCITDRSLMPHKSADIRLDVTPTHAGRYEVSVNQCRLSDPLGIWTKDITSTDRGGLTSFPEIYQMHIRPVSSAAMPESDIYSVRMKGSVAGDTVDIKEYVPGDPIRNIHWKLSEKVDKLLVRELGEPVTDNYLLLLDSAAGVAQDPEGLDAIASVFASLMHSLRLSGFAFSAGWTDPATGKVVIRKIVTEDDYREAADSFLAIPAVAHSAFGRMKSDVTESRYARVIIVGPRVPEDIEAIANGCEATVLMYEGGENLSDAGVTVVGFDSKHYKEELSILEL